MQFTCFLEAKAQSYIHILTCTFLYIMIVAGIIAGGATAGGANGLKPISPIIIFIIISSYYNY